MNDVFGQEYAAAYDLFYAGKSYEAECDVLERAFREFSARPVLRVLDIGCGTGGHALPMARRGYEVVGVDRSPGMLAVAQAKAQAAGLASVITYVESDITAALDVAPCDAALMMFNVLGYQTSPQDVASALKVVRQSLRPGGLFLFDAWQTEAVEREPPAPRERLYEEDGDKWIRRSSGHLDREHDICTVTIQVHRLLDGQIAAETVEHHRVRHFSHETLIELLAAAGIDLVRLGRFPDYWNDTDPQDWNVMGIGQAGV